MGILDDFGDLLNDTVTWEQRTGHVSGAPVYAAAICYPARIDRKQDLTDSSQALTVRGLMIIGGAPAVQPPDRIVLSSGERVPILDVVTIDDECGTPHHVEVIFGSMPDRCSIARLTRSAISGGGYSGAYAAAHATDRPCKVNQPDPAEIRQANALGVEYLTPIHLMPDEDVQALDQITITDSQVASRVGIACKVLHVVDPSEPRYRLAECEHVIGT